MVDCRTDIPGVLRLRGFGMDAILNDNSYLAMAERIYRRHRTLENNPETRNNNKKKKILNIITVSYTHLDVYKRQL